MIIPRSTYYLANDIIPFLVDESCSISFIDYLLVGFEAVCYLAVVRDAVKICMGGWLGGSVGEDTC